MAQQVRCHCSKRPLLGLVHTDENGELFLEIKVYKGGKLFGHMVTDGDIHLQCRECLRWTHTKVTKSEALSAKRPLPDRFRQVLQKPKK